MSGVLNRQLNTFAGRSKHAVVAAAAAAARHHGRTPSSTTAATAFVSIARNSSSSLAGCASDNNNSSSTAAATNNNVANRNRFDSADRCEDDAAYRRAPAASAASALSTGSRAGGRASASRVGMGAEAPAVPTLPSSGTTHGGGARRAVASIATSPSSSRPAPAPRVPLSGGSVLSAPPSSLLAPTASAYSSSSLLAPSAAGGAARVDAVVIGAGQAGLSVAYHLQKAGGLRVVALDANQVWMYAHAREGCRVRRTRLVCRALGVALPVTSPSTLNDLHPYSLFYALAFLDYILIFSVDHVLMCSHRECPLHAAFSRKNLARHELSLRGSIFPPVFVSTPFYDVFRPTCYLV